MSDLGKAVRLQRLFQSSSGRAFFVALDHLCNYTGELPQALREMAKTLADVAAGRPSGIVLNKGAALRFFRPYAGQIPLLIQQTAIRRDSPYFVVHASVEEVVRLGADAIAVALCVRHEEEALHLSHLGKVVTEAQRYGLPVIPHIYPLRYEGGQRTVSLAPEDIFYAVRVGLELGADAVKVPFTGDVLSFQDIVRQTPIPIVCAGGPQCDTLGDALTMVRKIVESGAAGATMGRNVWGFPPVTETTVQIRRILLEE